MGLNTCQVNGGGENFRFTRPRSVGWTGGLWLEMPKYLVTISNSLRSKETLLTFRWHRRSRSRWRRPARTVDARPGPDGQSHHKPLQFVVAVQGAPLPAWQRRPRVGSTGDQLGTSTLLTTWITPLDW